MIKLKSGKYQNVSLAFETLIAHFSLIWDIQKAISMILNLISSPRNISTATMYSFANHGAFKVMDEPFYAYYLNLTNADHPGKEDIIESQPISTSGVIDWINSTENKYGNVFVKNMAHHLIEMNLDFLHEYMNVLLIRNPEQLITSFAKVIPNPKMSDIGVKRQYEIYEFLGDKCVILDSNEVLKNPEKVLSQLFDRLSISFDPKMLHWSKGSLPEDGVWAKYWYNNVHNSTGFSKRITRKKTIPPHCQELLEESIPFYQELYKHAIKAD